VRIRKIKNGLAGGNAPGVRAEAHAIKGSAGQVGAMHVSQLCREIEAAALRQDLAEAGRLLPQLEDAFAAVRTAMSQAKIA
jgi:histidine phosphotransfer protein HptB